MRAADEIVDIGPGAGVHGGYVVAQGSVQDIIACEESITGQYLSGKKFIPVPAERRAGSGRSLIVRGAKENNLKNIDVELPLGTFICVTGVSGSGKSSLVGEIISKSLAVELNGAVKVRPGRFDRLEGLEHLDKVINIDQSPIGRSPRSNPATSPGCSPIYATCSPPCPRARCAGSARAGSPSTSRAAGARPARATAS